MLWSFTNQLFGLHCKSIDCFRYNGNSGVNWVKRCDWNQWNWHNVKTTLTWISLHPSIYLSICMESFNTSCYLTLSWQRSPSYRNESTDLLCKLTYWILNDSDLHRERVKYCWQNRGTNISDIRYLSINIYIVQKGIVYFNHRDCTI